jgi:peptidyl-prolyl cis-trans isomerase B (cyclophilin B)
VSPGATGPSPTICRMLVRPALIALAATLALTGCGGSDERATARDAAPTTGAECSYEADGSAAKEVDPPPAVATRTGEVGVTIATSVGAIGAELDADSAPCTVNSFLSLAEQGYFDATSCHRLTTPAAGISVLQCGDPTGTGSGGPGYAFADELSGHETYPEGTLAMANAGPDTNGSQFFMVYGDTPLPADYTVFGHLTPAGVKVVQDVAARGTTTGGPDGPPKQAVEIESVTVDGS